MWECLTTSAPLAPTPAWSEAIATGGKLVLKVHYEWVIDLCTVCVSNMASACTASS